MKIIRSKPTPHGVAETPGNIGSERLLGKYAKSSPHPDKKSSSLTPEVEAKIRASRRVGFALNDASRNLVCARGREEGLDFPQTYHRVATCRWSVIGRNGFVRFDPESGRGYLTNVETCGNVWVCPLCTAVVQERRRQEVAQAIDWADEHGLQSMMMTFTFPHEFAHDLVDLLKRQAKALEYLRKGANWDRFKKLIGYQGLIRSLEITFGENGWHPHTHELFFVSSQAEAERVRERLSDLWESACVRAGLLDLSDLRRVLAFRDHGVQVIGWCAASDYLAKMDESRHWGADRELAKASSKAGRASGQHPFGLLAAAAAGDASAGDRFMEYLDGMKGKRQMFWSHGLKARVGVLDASDEEIAAEVDPDLVLTAGFDSLNYNRVCRLGKRALMIETGEAGYAVGGIPGAQQSLTAFFVLLYGMERGS